MREKGIGGLPVVDQSGNKAIGNISIRDVQYLLTAPEIYKDYRCAKQVACFNFKFLCPELQDLTNGIFISNLHP